MSQGGHQLTNYLRPMDSLSLPTLVNPLGQNSPLCALEVRESTEYKPCQVMCEMREVLLQM